MAAALLNYDPYRSVTTGNWYLDNWPNYIPVIPSPIKPMVLSVVDGAFRETERVDWSCPVMPEEVQGAKDYIEALGGAVVLI